MALGGEEPDLLYLFDQVNSWSRADERAPHKPLLLLLALARVQRGEPRLYPFEEAEPKLGELLRSYGPQRTSYHPEYPFWRLQRDGLWQVEGSSSFADAIAGRPRQGDVPPRILRAGGARAGFLPDIHARLVGSPGLVNRLAARLLEGNFPSSYHDDLLDAVGMPWVVDPGAGRKRDPAFRESVLRAYEHRCAVCGYDGRLGTSDLGLEAAHLMWYAAGGPDAIDNGLALCVFHHRALDRGALGIDGDRRILLSQHVHGSRRVDGLLGDFSGQPLRQPQAGCEPLRESFRLWHLKHVFRSPARAVPPLDPME